MFIIINENPAAPASVRFRKGAEYEYEVQTYMERSIIPANQKLNDFSDGFIVFENFKEHHH